MLASITPLGERGRNRSWPVTVAFYLLGSALGGAALGMVAGAAGAILRRLADPPGALVLLVVGSAAAAALFLDTGRSVPTLRRQVNEDWLRRYRSWVYGLGFGVQLGAGVATVVNSASTYLVIVVAAGAGAAGGGAASGGATSGGVRVAVAIGCTYGLARALPILATARVTSFTQLGRFHQRLAALQPGARRLNLATELLVALAAGGRALFLVAR